MSVMIGRIALHDVPAAPDNAREVVLWSGRLDNRPEFALQYRDHVGAIADDTTLAGAVYKRHGLRGLGQLIGDWCLAIHDRQRGEAVLATDFAGVRPPTIVSMPGSCPGRRLSSHS
jgi:asparagine synthetase B (glutamine-hydrolysing)